MTLKLPAVATKKTEVLTKHIAAEAKTRSRRDGAGGEDVAAMVRQRPSKRTFPACARPPSCMVMIGDEASSTILRELDEDEVQEISREIARVQSLDIRGSRRRARRVLPDGRGARLRGQGRRRLRAQNPDQRLRAGAGQEDAGPADEDAGQRNAQLRRAAENRSAAARQVHSQRASADHRADSFAPESVAGRGPAVFAAGRAARRRGAADGQPGPDLAGDHLEDRRRDRLQAQSRWAS